MDQVSGAAGLVAIESTDGDPTRKRKDVTRKRKELEQGGEVSGYEPSPYCSGARPELNRKRHDPVSTFQAEACSFPACSFSCSDFCVDRNVLHGSSKLRDSQKRTKDNTSPGAIENVVLGDCIVVDVSDEVAPASRPNLKTHGSAAPQSPKDRRDRSLKYSKEGPIDEDKLRGKKERCGALKESDSHDSIALFAGWPGDGFPGCRLKLKKLGRLEKLIEQLSRNEYSDQKVDCRGEGGDLGRPGMLEKLCRAMLNNTRSVKLDLKSCVIGDEGCLVVSKTLLQHPSCRLQWIDLAENSIHRLGAKALFDGIERCHTLRYVDLRNNHISERGLKSIRKLEQRLRHRGRYVEFEVASNSSESRRGRAPVLSEGSDSSDYVESESASDRGFNLSDSDDDGILARASVDAFAAPHQARDSRHELLQGSCPTNMQHSPLTSCKASNNGATVARDPHGKRKIPKKRHSFETSRGAGEKCHSRFCSKWGDGEDWSSGVEYAEDRVEDGNAEDWYDDGELSDDRVEEYRRSAGEWEGLEGESGMNGRERAGRLLQAMEERLYQEKNARNQSHTVTGNVHAFRRFQGGAGHRRGVHITGLHARGDSEGRSSDGSSMRNKFRRVFNKDERLPAITTNLERTFNPPATESGSSAVSPLHESTGAPEGSLRGRGATSWDRVGSKTHGEENVPTVGSRDHEAEDFAVLGLEFPRRLAIFALDPKFRGTRVSAVLPVVDLSPGVELPRAVLRAGGNCVGPDRDLSLGFGRLQRSLELARSSQEGASSGMWTDAEALDFLVEVLAQIRACDDQGRGLCPEARGGLQVKVLRETENLLKQNGCLANAVGNAAWCRLYAQFHIFCLHWLHAFACWRVKPARPDFSEDFDALTRNYAFSKHAGRVLRSILYLLDTRHPQIQRFIADRFRSGEDSSGNTEHTCIEAVLLVWATLIRLLDCPPQEGATRPGGYWRALADHIAAEWNRFPGRFSLPQLREVPSASASGDDDVIAPPSQRCSREEAVELGWEALIVSTLVYRMCDVPMREGGWELLTVLLDLSPLLAPDAVSSRYSSGALFCNAQYRGSLYAGGDSDRLAFEVELVRRCAALAASWPLQSSSETGGKWCYANLNLLSRPGAKKRGLISELWRSAVERRQSRQLRVQLGKMPAGYPFQMDSDRTVTSLPEAVLLLLQDMFLRAQQRDTAVPAPVFPGSEHTVNSRKLLSQLLAAISKKSKIRIGAPRRRASPILMPWLQPTPNQRCWFLANPQAEPRQAILLRIEEHPQVTFVLRAEAGSELRAFHMSQLFQEVPVDPAEELQEEENEEGVACDNRDRFAADLALLLRLAKLCHAWEEVWQTMEAMVVIPKSVSGGSGAALRGSDWTDKEQIKVDWAVRVDYMDAVMEMLGTLLVRPDVKPAALRPVMQRLVALAQVSAGEVSLLSQGRFTQSAPSNEFQGRFRHPQLAGEARPIVAGPNEALVRQSREKRLAHAWDELGLVAKRLADLVSKIVGLSSAEASGRVELLSRMVDRELVRVVERWGPGLPAAGLAVAQVLDLVSEMCSSLTKLAARNFVAPADAIEGGGADSQDVEELRMFFLVEALQPIQEAASVVQSCQDSVTMVLHRALDYRADPSAHAVLISAARCQAKLLSLSMRKTSGKPSLAKLEKKAERVHVREAFALFAHFFLRDIQCPLDVFWLTGEVDGTSTIREVLVRVWLRAMLDLRKYSISAPAWGATGDIRQQQDAFFPDLQQSMTYQLSILADYSDASLGCFNAVHAAMTAPSVCGPFAASAEADLIFPHKSRQDRATSFHPANFILTECSLLPGVLILA